MSNSTLPECLVPKPYPSQLVLTKLPLPLNNITNLPLKAVGKVFPILPLSTVSLSFSLWFKASVFV